MLQMFRFTFALSLTILISTWLASDVSAQSSAPHTYAPADTAPAAHPPAAAAADATAISEQSAQTNTQAAPVPGLDMKTGTPLYETIQEDWSSLQVGMSKLEPEKPIVGDVSNEEKFSRQLVSLKWRPGDPIDLWIILPKGVHNPPAVLFLYSYNEDTDRFRNNAWCERVTSGGIAAVGFVSALSGPRFHDRPMRQWFLSELQESLGSTVHDVKFILDYLTSRGNVDMSRVGMFGQGSGATIAILAATADPRIKAIDLLEPWGDWTHFLTKSALLQIDPTPEHPASYAKPDFLKKVAPLDPVQYLPKLSIPIRLQQVKDNNIVPMESKEALKNALPAQAQVRRFATASTMLDQEKGGALFAWLAGEVNAMPSAPQANAKPGTSPVAEPASAAASIRAVQ